MHQLEDCVLAIRFQLRRYVSEISSDAGRLLLLFQLSAAIWSIHGLACPPPSVHRLAQTLNVVAWLVRRDLN
jgi:hypothetical protein